MFPITFSPTCRHSGWEHVNLTGDYVWSPDETTENLTASGHSGPLQIQHPLRRKFVVCPLMLQKYAFR